MTDTEINRLLGQIEEQYKSLNARADAASKERKEAVEQIHAIQLAATEDRTFVYAKMEAIQEAMERHEREPNGRQRIINKGNAAIGGGALSLIGILEALRVVVG